MVSEYSSKLLTRRMLQCGGTPVALMSDLGLLFSRDRHPADLMAVYRRRRLDDITSLVLRDL